MVPNFCRASTASWLLSFLPADLVRPPKSLHRTAAWLNHAPVAMRSLWDPCPEECHNFPERLLIAPIIPPAGLEQDGDDRQLRDCGLNRGTGLIQDAIIEGEQIRAVLVLR